MATFGNDLVRAMSAGTIQEVLTILGFTEGEKEEFACVDLTRDVVTACRNLEEVGRGDLIDRLHDAVEVALGA